MKYKKSYSHHRRISRLVSLRNNSVKVFLMLETVSLNPCKMSRKLPITKSDYSNVTGVALLKSLSAVNILLRILEEKNASERLLRQLKPISILWLYI